MDSRLEDLVQREDSLFSQRTSLVSLWQLIADEFFQERADFTTTRYLGSDFATGQMLSYPSMARRDLANSLSAVLRPSTTDWFSMSVSMEDNIDHDGRAWLQYATGVQRRAMFDRSSQFARATKEGDHDFATFGQCVLSIELNMEGNGLLYRCWHLRDCAWAENYDGHIDTLFRRWEPTIRELIQIFPKTIPSELKQRLEKEPYAKVKCARAVLPAKDFDSKLKTPYVSVYYLKDEKVILEEVGLKTFNHVIPRWQTVSGSQYAYSPATIVALPDARLIQAMTRVLLEAGEKAVDPPMIAVRDAIRSDVAVYAGGITWADAAYDERLGEVLRPITQDKSGMPLGLQMQQDTREMIAEAFYLNKLTLPPPDREMTAYEAGQRVSEYIRQALPIFEPMEADYNGALCEITFELLMRNGAFGPTHTIPRSLSGAEVRFKFQNPLRSAVDEQKSNLLLQSQSLLAQVVQLDPSAADIVDAKTALRDALYAIGVPVKWLRSEEDLAQRESQARQMQQAQQLLGGLEQGAGIAEKLSKAQAVQATTETV